MDVDLKRRKVFVTLLVSALEIWTLLQYNLLTLLRDFIFLIFRTETDILDAIALVTPAGVLYLMNWYFVTPLVEVAFELIQSKIGDFRPIDKQYKVIVRKLNNWLVNMPCHWGAVDKATETQNANTCEALIALYKSGMYKNEVFRSTLSKINLEVNERGLCSKSLGKGTVVCTSMILYLMGELKGKVDYEIWHDKYDALARRLWNSRCKYGWGVFMEKPSFEDCSNVNSIWALRALNQYSTRDTREFKEFILEFYEHSKFGKFGFSQQDSSRLTPTAMAIVLYYELEPNLRRRIMQRYKVDEAIKYVFEQFVNKGIDYEVETLIGIKKANMGVAKAPWNHILIGYAIEALTLAYKYGNLKIYQMNKCVKRIELILKSSLYNETPDEMYYIPEKMERHGLGNYTYPTAYLVWGLNCFLNERRKSNEIFKWRR